MQRRRMIRRGGTYGPPLPEGKPEDGLERGIAASSVGRVWYDSLSLR